MDLINIECLDNFNIRCGEIYLTSECKMELHCTLCEGKFKLLQEFATHIGNKHRPTDPTLYGKDMDDAVILILNGDDSASNADSLSDLKELEDSFDNDELSDFESAAQTNQLPTSNIAEENEVDKKNENSKIYTCPHCHQYKGSDISNFKSHVKRHFARNKTKKCTKCPKRFHSMCELKRHLYIHSGEKPYRCQECGAAYTNKHKLTEHLKRHTNVRNVPCTQCEKRFYNKAALRVHMAVHTSERRFKCDICCAAFKLKKGLQTHIKIHENRLQYKCKHCPARFNQNSGLRSHVISKHDGQGLHPVSLGL